MPVPNDNSRPPAAWCYSGNQIRRWRTLANVSREALAAAANYAPETISSMERGVRMPSPRLLDIADELCGAQGMLSAAKEYVRRERYSARAVDFIEREREATSLWTYEVALVPGLLQTRAYAKALIDNRIPPLDEETVEERVTARMERQTILTARKPPVGLSFVLYEAVLRSQLVDEEQLQRLLEVSRLRNVVLQVLPFEKAFANALEGPMVLLEGPDHDRCAFMEGGLASEFSADPGVVSRVTERLSMIRTRALDPDETARLIERMVGRRE
ncbi:DUF5753 domain-containing protein [Streptomyces parvulus]|uniref:DUF5753 domain-containing protein n=1 Tax=Streptomyces parvulus TaxID=146923 RepID=A0ABV5D6H7_9ACTN|nr:DUF5753 domain-containing protein [Streptomyces parvulus]